jgi:hypothetical protein
METEAFINPIRAQLTTAQYKPCTYFAFDRNGTRVFVKGPYRDEGHVQLSMNVIKFKSIFDVPVIPVRSVQLIPDGMSDCQYGIRMTLDKTKPRFFQVSDDIMILEKTLPVIERSSQTAWPIPVSVVDWAKIKLYSHVEYNKNYVKMIYTADKTAAYDFVKHIILSWVCGAGMDMDFNNFIHDKGVHKVFQVDHEGWLDFDWSVRNTRVGSSRNKAWHHLNKFITSEQHVFNEFFTNLTSDKSIARINELFSPPEAKLLVERLNKVAIDWTVIGIHLPHSPPLKRSLEFEEDADTVVAKKSKVTPDKFVNGIYVGQCTPTPPVDPWGFPVSTRMCDLQMAIRRGKFHQAMVAFFSCYNIHKIYPDVEDAKIIKDDVIKTLMMCAINDVGVANVNLTMRVVDLLRTIGDQPLIFTRVIYNLCLSYKTAVQKHFAHAFHPQNETLRKSMGVDCNKNPTSFKDLGWFYVAAETPDTVWKYLKAYHPLLYSTYCQTGEISILWFAISSEFFKERNPVTERCFLMPLPTDDPLIHDVYMNKHKLDPLECSYENKNTVLQKRTEESVLYNECILFKYSIYKAIYFSSNLFY